MSDSADVDELHRRLERLQLLTEAAAALWGATTPLQVADVAVAEFDRLLGTSSVAVFELRGSDSLDAMTLGGWVQGARDAWTTMPLDAPAPVADAARARTPVWTESAGEWHSRYPHLVEMLDGYGYSGVLGLPLVAAGELVGAVGIGFFEDRALDPDERAVVTALGDHCAQAMQRARLLQVESEARRTAEQLTAMVAALSRSRTPRQVTEAIGEAATALGASGSVVAVRVQGDRLNLLSTTGDTAPPLALSLAAAHPLAYATRTGKPVWLARRSQLAWRDRSFDASSLAPAVDVAVPMFLDDQTVGAIGMAFPDAPPHFSREQRRAILTLAGQSAQALDRARLQQVEHDIAETLQRSLLPDRLPELERLALAARYLPGAEGSQAGGDWYDVIELTGPRVALVVGDVVGKGPAAAALMGQLRTALAAALLRGDMPAAALHQLDRFSARVPGARASTVVCVVLDWEAGVLCWASAGHPAPVLVTGTGGRLLAATAGPALALPGATVFREQEEVALLPGSTLILYTDGLVERRGELVDEGLARLVDAGAHRADQPPAQLGDALLRELLDDAGPADDVALLLTRLVPPPWSGRLPAVPAQLSHLRVAVGDWAVAAGLDTVQAEDLQFALGEAAANAVEHAYRGRAGGDVTVGLERRGDGAVLVRVGDSGAWRPPPADPGYRGRGLQIIRAVGVDVELTHGPQGTRIAFVVPPPPPGTLEQTPKRHPAPPQADAVVAVTRSGELTSVSIVGELDLAGADALRDRLVTIVAEAPDGGRIVLDLRDTGYVASAGVALLLDTVEQAERRGLTVEATMHPHGAVARILALTGVGALLGVAVPAQPSEPTSIVT